MEQLLIPTYQIISRLCVTIRLTRHRHMGGGGRASFEQYNL